MKKKYFLIIAFFSIIFISCSKKDVQLPLIHSDGISKIYNHSSIWLFFEENEKDTLAVLNKNNKIINTQWIFHIDRRLTMKHVVPNLIEIQRAKFKPSMHKKEGTGIYYSYANTKSNNISLFEFKPTNYVWTNNLITDDIDTGRFIRIDLQNDRVYVNRTKSNIEQLKDILENYKSKDSLNNTKIFLKYNEELSYQNYLQTKMILSKINMAIDSTEYIYSLK